MDRSVLKGIVLIGIAAAVLVALYAVPGSKQASKSHPPNNDPWVLVSYDPNNQYGTYLSNGFISTRIMGDGVGSQDGRPLPCFVSGLYDDEKLIPCPTWSDLRFYDGKTQFKIDKSADYKQTLNMKTGILTTEATWRAGDKTLKGKIEVIVSRAEPNVGLVIATLTPDFSGWIRAEAPLTSLSDRVEKLSTSRNMYNTALTCVFRTKSSGVYLAYLGKLETDSPSKAVAQADGPAKVAAVRRRNIAFALCVSISTGDTSESAQESAHSALPMTRGMNLYDAVPSHKSAMAKLWRHDIIIDGPIADQQAIHSCMFYLLQSVREGSDWSIPPMGLSNNAFTGHVFWDADVWMFPALILQHPELAQSIVAYRQKTLPGAMANAKTDGFSGAQYAWESGSTGKEDTPTGLVYRHERHINGDVALAQWQYYLSTGDSKWLKSSGYPVIRATADYWVSRAKLVPEKGRYEVLQVVPPDENADLVNNSAYTNCIARMNLDIAAGAAIATGAAPNPKWAEVASKLYIPYDSAKLRFIAFDNYKGMQAKQADTELLAFPLQFTLPGQDMRPIYRSTYDFYAPKVLVNGPAMTSSAHAVIAARLGDTDKAYDAFTKSYKPFLRGPFNYFNEKRSTTVDNMCFLTGAAGPITAVLYGFAGIHMDYFPADPGASDLQFKPCLPKQWKSLKITGIQWHGRTRDITISKGNKVSIR